MPIRYIQLYYERSIVEKSSLGKHIYAYGEIVVWQRWFLDDFIESEQKKSRANEKYLSMPASDSIFSKCKYHNFGSESTPYVAQVMSSCSILIEGNEIKKNTKEK